MLKVLVLLFSPFITYLKKRKKTQIEKDEHDDDDNKGGQVHERSTEVTSFVNWHFYCSKLQNLCVCST